MAYVGSTWPTNSDVKGMRGEAVRRDRVAGNGKLQAELKVKVDVQIIIYSVIENPR